MEAARDLVAFLRGQSPLPEHLLADTVTLYVAPLASRVPELARLAR